jgi:hypothetical protein
MLSFAALQAAGMMPGLGVIMAAGRHDHHLEVKLNPARKGLHRKEEPKENAGRPALAEPAPR